MALLWRLLRDVGLAYLGAALLGFLASSDVVDQLGGEQLATLRLAHTWGVLLEFAVSAAAAWLYTRTFRRALARAGELGREEAVEAAISAHRLPIRMGLTTLGVAVLGIVLASARALEGDAPDLALGGVAIGLGIGATVVWAGERGSAD